MRLDLAIVGDDILGFLYRYRELAPADAAPVSTGEIAKARRTAGALIRSHRLWETYLCNAMGYCDIHAPPCAPVRTCH